MDHVAVHRLRFRYPIGSIEKQAGRLEAAVKVFHEIIDIPDSAIPNELLSRCECIAIIPSMKKGGFIVGGRHGKGAVSCRKGDGKGPWGPPAMIIVEGGSFGLQIGGAAVDVVMLFMDKEGVSSLLKGKFTVGADASAAAGPVGRDATAGTDVLMKAKILSYSRSRGAFAGFELKGAVVKQDKDGNRTLIWERHRPQGPGHRGQGGYPARRSASHSNPYEICTSTTEEALVRAVENLNSYGGRFVHQIKSDQPPRMVRGPSGPLAELRH